MNRNIMQTKKNNLNWYRKFVLSLYYNRDTIYKVQCGQIIRHEENG